MHFVHIIDSLGRGGAETLLVGIVNGLPQHRHTIVLLYDTNEFKNEINQAEVVSLDCPHLRQIPVAVIRLKKILRKLKPDIIHSHLYWSNFVARMAVKKGIPYFYSNHAVQSYAAFKNKKLVWLERFAYRKWHHLISVSHTVEDDYCRFIRVTGPHDVLYNFVEDRFFNTVKKQLPTGHWKGVAVGRLATQKNYPYLLEGVRRAGCPVKVDIYGIGPELESLQQLITAGSNDKVELKLLHSRISDIINDYHFFIMSSIFEGQPVSLLEAMAAGLPVLLSDIPVLREVAGNAGLYFSLDDPGNLAKLLEDISSGKIDLEPYKLLSAERAAAIAKKENYLLNLLALYNKETNKPINP